MPMAGLCLACMRRAKPQALYYQVYTGATSVLRGQSSENCWRKRRRTTSLMLECGTMRSGSPPDWHKPCALRAADGVIGE
mgnify:CR=1 FL=1